MWGLLLMTAEIVSGKTHTGWQIVHYLFTNCINILFTIVQWQIPIQGILVRSTLMQQNRKIRAQKGTKNVCLSQLYCTTAN